MKPSPLVLSALALSVAGTTRARTPPPTASATFAEILRRVEVREKTTGAIVSVKAREDAPTPGASLQFSLVRDGDVAVVTLQRRWKTGPEVYEQYRLQVVPAIREELDRLARWRAAEVGAQDERRRSIPTLTAGKLRYGMSVEQVEKVMGRGRREAPGAAAGALTLAYPGLTLYFQGFRLTWAERPNPLR